MADRLLNPGDPRYRYNTDPLFRTMVDAFRVQIRKANMTPSELREAVLLAAILESEQNPGAIEWVPKREVDRG